MNKEQLQTAWKNLAANKKNSRRDHVHYCILRALLSKEEDKAAVAKHLLRKHFTPVTSEAKLANGRTPFDTVTNCLHWYSFGPGAYAKGIILGVPIAELLTEEEFTEFRAICDSLRGPNTNFVRRYSYFFTRQDIFDEYQLVQTAHAALELGSKLGEAAAKDLYFTCCGVANLEELENVERVLQMMKVEYVAFREPDIGNQMTAIGVYPIEEHHRGLLRNYKLLRFTTPTVTIREFDLETA